MDVVQINPFPNSSCLLTFVPSVSATMAVIQIFYDGKAGGRAIPGKVGISHPCQVAFPNPFVPEGKQVFRKQPVACC